MSLRQKTLLITTGVILISLTLLIVGIQIILQQNYLELEARAVRHDLERIANLLTEQANRLAVTTGDYAFWDDTYAFVAGSFPTYPEVNLYDDLFVQQQVDVMLFLTPDEQVYFAKAFDLGREQAIALPDEWRDGLLQSPRPTELATAVGALLALPDGLWMTGAANILPSSREGESRGTLIWGRRMEAVQVNRLADTLNYDLSILPLPDEAQPAQVTALNDTRVAGTAVLDTARAANAPQYGVQIEVSRDIVQEGRGTGLLVTIVFLIAGAALVAAVLLLLERLVLARLKTLSDGVRQIEQSGTLSGRVQVEGRDELAALGEQINRTLSTVETAQQQLHQVNAELQKTINIRAAEQMQREHFYLQAANELRSPLSRFRTSLYLLRKRPERLAEHSDTLEGVLDEMTRLVTDLLEISRLQQGILKLKLEPTPVQTVLQAALDSQMWLIRRRALRFTANLPETPLYVNIDAERITQAFATLVSAAAQNSAEQEALTLTAEAEPDGACVIVCIVGGRLNLEAEAAASHGALGGRVGMTIAKELIELHNASISMENRTTDSMIIVRLPIAFGTELPMPPIMQQN